MKLWPFSRKNSEQIPDVPPEMQEYYGAPQPGARGRIVLIVAAVVVLAGIGAALYFWGPWGSNGSNTSNNTASSGQNGVMQQPPNSPSPSGNTDGNSSASGNNSSNAPSQSNEHGNRSDSSSTGQHQNQSGASKAPNTIANTGPGDVVAVFAGSVILAAVLYELRLYYLAQRR